MSCCRTRVGVVGLGKMGEFHLQKYLAMPEVEVVGIVDRDLERAADISGRYRVRSFESLSEILFEADAVSIASPTRAHFSVARQAIEAGVHVLIEKPITDTIDTAEELVRLARQKGVTIQVGLIERFRFLAMARSLRMGDIRFVETHRLSPFLSRENDIDVVTDLMIHDLDLVLSLVGSDPCFISAIGIPVITKHFDLANVRLEFPGGAVANMNVSRVSSEGMRKIRVFFWEGYASLDLSSNRIKYCAKNADGRIEKVETEVSVIDPLLEQCRHFVECICAKKVPVVSGEDGVRALRFAKLVKEKISERASLFSRGADLSDGVISTASLTGDESRWNKRV